MTSQKVAKDAQICAISSAMRSFCKHVSSAAALARRETNCKGPIVNFVPRGTRSVMNDQGREIINVSECAVFRTIYLVYQRVRSGRYCTKHSSKAAAGGRDADFWFSIT